MNKESYIVLVGGKIMFESCTLLHIVNWINLWIQNNNMDAEEALESFRVIKGVSLDYNIEEHPTIKFDS